MVVPRQVRMPAMPYRYVKQYLLAVIGAVISIVKTWKSTENSDTYNLIIKIRKSRKLSLRKQRYLQLSNYHSRVLENISILSRTCFTSVIDTSWEGKPQGILILTCNDEIKKEIQIPWVMLSVITTQVIKILPVMDLVNPVEQDPTEDTAYQQAMEQRRNDVVVAQ